jgi:hypothetical protein
MTVLLVVVAWIALSVLVALSWVGYRTFVAKHSLEEFDSVNPRPTGVADRFHGLTSVPLVPGQRAHRS